jgi:hypothetical protein
MPNWLSVWRKRQKLVILDLLLGLDISVNVHFDITSPGILIDKKTV